MINKRLAKIHKVETSIDNELIKSNGENFKSMEAKILNGNKCRDSIFTTLKKEILQGKTKYEIAPGIAFIACVGHLPLMKYTIALHVSTAKELGFKVSTEICPHTISTHELCDVIAKYNRMDSIHAIVFLQPAPKHINPIRVIQAIDKSKEVEGFHPENVLETLTKGLHNTKFPMCLPLSLIELFKAHRIKIEDGKEVVFVADQDFIANPFRSLILRTAASQVVPAACAMTMVATENKKVREYCAKADFLFVITEKPEFIQPDWLKPGVCIVDIYANLVKEIPAKNNPETTLPVIRGGVNTEKVLHIAGHIAPCPGGIMPVLLAVLFRNAFMAYKSSIFVKSKVF